MTMFLIKTKLLYIKDVCDMRCRRFFLHNRGYYDYVFQMEDCEYEDLMATLEQLSEFDESVKQCIDIIRQTTSNPEYNETQFFVPGNKSDLVAIVVFATTRLAKKMLNGVR